MPTSPQLPALGFGLGLRKEHYTTILETTPDVEWFEVLTENYLVPGGKPRYFLDQIRERYPVVMHGVSMSIGSSDALNMDYLQQVEMYCGIWCMSNKWGSNILLHDI